MNREEAKREMLFAKRNVMAGSYIDQAYDVAIQALSEPERKTGEWISIFDEDESKCSECGEEYYYPKSRGYHFCPNCGSDNRWEEK
jgi:uncharacterized OB-fold protein